MSEVSDEQLEAYLDEALPAEQLARIEQLLRERPELLTRLSAINARRDAGVHSLGGIWRRHRLTCPPRQQWGSYLLGVLPEAEARYFEFHLREIGCRWCQANFDDLSQQQQVAGNAQVTAQRRTRYFQTSAGYLKPKQP